MIVTVLYFDHLANQSATRKHEVKDTARETIAATVDLFDAQVGTVLAVYDEDGRRLHKAAVTEFDLMR